MKFIALVLIAIGVCSCGKAKAGGGTVQVLQSPMAGYTCFGIVNEAGDTVGGNCSKD